MKIAINRAEIKPNTWCAQHKVHVPAKNRQAGTAPDLRLINNN